MEELQGLAEILYNPKFTEIFNPQLVPSLCAKTNCWCQPEILMTKWKL